MIYYTKLLGLRFGKFRALSATHIFADLE